MTAATPAAPSVAPAPPAAPRECAAVRATRTILGSKLLGWSTLRALGTSPLAKATIVMPLLGYLLILNSWFLEKSGLAPPQGQVPLMHTHAWRFVLIYYGLTCTGIATALFGFFCPTPQKKYADGIDYAREVNELFALDTKWTSLAATLMEIETRRPSFFKWLCSEDLRQDLKLRCREIEGATPLEETTRTRTAPQKGAALIMAALRTQYALTNVETAWARALVFVLYAIGILFVSASAIWGIAEVTATVFRWSLPSSPF